MSFHLRSLVVIGASTNILENQLSFPITFNLLKLNVLKVLSQTLDKQTLDTTNPRHERERERGNDFEVTFHSLNYKRCILSHLGVKNKILKKSYLDQSFDS